MRTLLEDEEIVRELRGLSKARFVDILRVLNAGRVKFIIVSRAVESALDFVYRRDGENIRRMVEALLPFNPRLRTAPARVNFSWDEQSVAAGLNFPLVTTLGDINLFSETSDGRAYEHLLPHSVTTILLGQRCQCALTLERRQCGQEALFN